MKTLFVTAFFVLAFSVTGSAQKCTEYTFPGKPFAICLPDGFKATQAKDSKDVEIEAPLSEKKYVSTITLRGEPRTEARSETTLKLINGAFGFAGYKNTRIISLTDLKLPSGLDATALVFFVDVDGVPLAVSYLLVDGPNKTNADFFLLYRRDDSATGMLIGSAIETIHAK
jgi:hypothetical protein